MRTAATNDLVRWKIAPLERRRRGIDERIAIGLPGVTRRMRAFVMRRPAGTPIRRAGLTRAARTGWAATNRDDYRAMQTSYHPDAEFFEPGRDTAGLGFDPVYHGPAGVEQFVKEWKSGFSRFTYEPREIADCGGDSFAARLGMIGKLRDAETLIVRQENFRDWSAALAALTER